MSRLSAAICGPGGVLVSDEQSKSARLRGGGCEQSQAALRFRNGAVPFEHMAPLGAEMEGKVKSLKWRSPGNVGEGVHVGPQGVPSSVPSSNLPFQHLLLNPLHRCYRVPLPGCRCSRPVPLRFWFQPRLSWPWRGGSVLQKVGSVLAFALEAWAASRSLGTRVCSWQCVLSISAPRGDLR